MAKKLREDYQKKKYRKGVKSMRGQPEDYDEIKEPFTVGITPTAKQGLKILGRKYQISVSELFERIGRQIFALNTDGTQD